jgi:hypothetical protein
MQGSNQNKITKTVTASVAGTKLTFTFDRAFPVKRIKLWSSATFVAGQKFRLTAEGENFYGGLDIPVAAVFVKTDDGATTAPLSPAVLTFDTPITCSKQFPLELTMSGDTSTWYVTLEGPSLV